jgi:hypothetical protein
VTIAGRALGDALARLQEHEIDAQPAAPARSIL